MEWNTAEESLGVEHNRKQASHVYDILGTLPRESLMGGLWLAHLGEYGNVLFGMMSL
jgi:hypothetical protein